METIHTIDTPDLTAKLNKSEIDMLHFIEGWLPTLSNWSVRELALKNHLDMVQGQEASEMLILHGLLQRATADLDGPRVSVTDAGAKWMRENNDTIYSLHLMLDTDQYDDSETATA